MNLLSPAISRLVRFRQWRTETWVANPIDTQREVLQDLVTHAQYTEIGRKFGLTKLFSLRDFKNAIPIHEYEDIQPYVERIMNGEENVLWNTPVNWFAKSSGTTNSKSKFIPITKESLEDCHFQGAKDVISLYYSLNPNSNMLTGKGLVIGGSHQMSGGGEGRVGDGGRDTLQPRRAHRQAGLEGLKHGCCPKRCGAKPPGWRSRPRRRRRCRSSAWRRWRRRSMIWHALSVSLGSPIRSGEDARHYSSTVPIPLSCHFVQVRRGGRWVSRRKLVQNANRAIWNCRRGSCFIRGNHHRQRITNMLGKIAGAFIGERVAGRGNGAKGILLGLLGARIARRGLGPLGTVIALGYGAKKLVEWQRGRSATAAYPPSATPTNPTV